MFALSNQDQAEAVGGRYSTLYYYEMRTEANNNSCWFGVVSGSRCGDRHDAIGDLVLQIEWLYVPERMIDRLV